MSLTSGVVLNNRYQIQAELGRGGFGAVYKAFDLQLKVEVAVKENLSTLPNADRQFEKEAQLLAKLRHPHLPRVTDHFVISPQEQYLVMDFIAGKNLAEMLQQTGRPLSESQALIWIDQICDALEYLHGRSPQVIHRDIKPQNIIITSDSQAVLVDFGIAKLHSATLSTATGRGNLTPGFAPPEQYGNQAQTDERSDIYAVGATLYNLLTGQVLPDAVDRMMGRTVTPKLRQLNRAISPKVERVILKAVEPGLNQRYQTVKLLRTALNPAANEPGWWSLISKEVIVGVVVSLLLGLLANTFFQSPSPPTPLPQIPFGDKGEGSTVVSPVTPTATPKIIAASATNTPVPLTATPILPTLTDMPVSLTATPIPPTPTQPLLVRGGSEMIRIPAGEFIMGSTQAQVDAAFEACQKVNNNGCQKEWFEREMPQYTVSLGEYFIDKYETTNAQYAECVTAGKCTAPYETKSNTRASYYGNADFANYPVIYVDWTQAKNYCEFVGKRLPIEAEWEKAARGTDGWTYPWGNEAPSCDRLNYYSDKACVGDTTAVGSYPSGASPYGVMDMSGNVWEWISSDYKPYPYKVDDGREDLLSNDNKVLRGGSWYGNVGNARSAFRFSNYPTNNSLNVGSRCAQ